MRIPIGPALVYSLGKAANRGTCMPLSRDGSNSVDWINRWIDAVASGDATMSQRAMTSIESHGGLEAVVEVARSKGVHLVQLTDDKGKVLVAASCDPFVTLC